MKKHIAYKYRADPLKVQLVQEDSDGNLNVVESKKNTEAVTNTVLNENIDQILKKLDNISNVDNSYYTLLNSKEAPEVKYKNRVPYMPSGKQYKCCWCMSFFSALSDVRNHPCMPRFICTDCDPHSTFKSKKALALHLSMDHLSSVFKCKECKYVSKTKTYLDKHVSRVHTLVAAPEIDQQLQDFQHVTTQRKKKKLESASSEDLFDGEDVIAGGVFLGDSTNLPYNEDVGNDSAENLSISTCADSVIVADDDGEAPQKKALRSCSNCQEMFSNQTDLQSHQKFCTGERAGSPDSNLAGSPDSTLAGRPQPKRVNPERELDEVNNSTDCSELDDSSSRLVLTHKSHKERMMDLLSGIKIQETITLDKERCQQCLRTQYSETSLHIHLRYCKGTYHLKARKVKCPFCKDPKMYFGSDTMLTQHMCFLHSHEQAMGKWKKIKREKMRREREAVLAQQGSGMREQ